MECTAIKEWLNGYLDNELPPAQTEQVRCHLADCPACREELGELEKVKGLIRSLPRQPAPAGILGCIAEPQPPNILWRYRWTIPPLATAAAMAMVVYISILSVPQYSRSLQPPTSVLSNKLGDKAEEYPELLSKLSVVHRDTADKAAASPGAPKPSAPAVDGVINTGGEPPSNGEPSRKPAGSPANRGTGTGEGFIQGKGGGITERSRSVSGGGAEKAKDNKIAKEFGKRAEEKNKNSEKELAESNGVLSDNENRKYDQKQEVVPDEDQVSQGFISGEVQDKAIGQTVQPAPSSGASSGKAAGRTGKMAPQIAISKSMIPVVIGSAVWQTMPLPDIIAQATSVKRLVFVHFYFSQKDSFPQNRDDKLMQYSLERAYFTRAFVRTDKDGKISDPEISGLFSRNKLGNVTQGVIFDYYGNIVHTVQPPLATNKITAGIDEADKKAASIESATNKSYAKADDLGNAGKTSEQIRILQQIVGIPYKGYPAITNAQDKLNLLNQAAITYQKTLLDNLAQQDEDTQNSDAVIKELEGIAKNYKGLPAEKEAQENIKRVRTQQSQQQKQGK